MSSPLTQYIKKKKAWFGTRFGIVLYEGTEWRNSDLLWIQLLRCAAACCCIIIVSGIMLSLWYEPSSRPLTDRKGQYQVLAYAQKTIIGTQGDTIISAGEAICIPIDNNKNREPILYDSLLKKSVQIVSSKNGNPIILSAASASVEYNITNRHPSGALIRGIHIWSVHLFIVCLMACSVAMLLLRSWRAPFELIWILFVLLFFTAAISAWSGYVLPWSIVSVVSAQVVTGVVKEYVPFIGDELAHTILNGGSITEYTLPRIFMLHAMVLPGIIIGLWIALARIIRRHTAFNKSVYVFRGYGWRIILSASALFICGLSYIVSPIRKGDSFIPADSLSAVSALPDSKPNWYFLPFYEMMNIVPTDAFIVLMILSIGILFFAPRLFRHRSDRMLYIGTILTILIFVWLGVRGLMH